MVRARAPVPAGHAADRHHPWNDEALAHLDEALTRSEHVHDETSQGCVHYTLSQVWAQQGDDRRAFAHCTRALHLFRAVGDLVWAAHLLNQVGLLSARLGDHDNAAWHCRTALTVQRQHRDREGEASTLDRMGYIEHHCGYPARAVDYYRQALAVWRELGDTYEAANTLDGLGHPYTALGKHDHAFAV